MLRILDGNFNITETIKRCISVSWKHRFTETGSFTIVLPNKEYSNIKKGNFIRYGKRYGIIEYIDKTNDELTVRGYDLKCVALYRIGDLKNYSGNAETVIKSIMSDNTTEKRGYSNFVITPDQKRGESITYDITAFDTIENHFKKICEDNQIGYDITVTDKKMYFDVAVPQTREAIYSLRRKNISGYEYTLDALQEKNIVVCTTKSEGLGLSKIEAGQTTYNGYVTLKSGTIYFKNGEKVTFDNEIRVQVAFSSSRVYAYYRADTGTYGIGAYSSVQVDSANIFFVYLGLATFDSTGIISGFSEAELPEYTVWHYKDEEQSGFARKEKSGDCDKWIDELVKISETATADVCKSEDYGTKWNIGDFVTIKIDIFGELLSFTRQITEVDESITASGAKVTPTFGTQKDNIIRKLIKGRMN